MSRATQAPARRRLRVVRLMPVLDFGGVESRVVLQAQLHDRHAFDLEVCTFHRPGAAAAAIREAGIPVTTIGVDPSVRNPMATLALVAYLRRVRPDVVHASIAEANLHVLAAARIARPRTVVVEEVGAPDRSRLATAVFGRLYRAADAIVGVTRMTCDSIERHDRSLASRVHLVYNCAGPVHFPDRPPAPRRRDPGLPLRVLMVGRLVPVKNQLMFLEAFARFSTTCRHVTLSIAGDGPLREALAARARELGVEGSVHFLGFREEIRELLQSSDLFVLPSLSEGCSVSLIEAMASGTPVLVSRVPGNLEVVGPLAHDCAVDPADVNAWVEALHRLDRLSPEACEQAALVAQRSAYERFSPRVYMQTLGNLYTSLASA